jgi:hypothetical protein
MATSKKGGWSAGAYVVLAVIILLSVLCVGGGYYWFVLRNHSQTVVNPPSAQQTNQPSVKTQPGQQQNQPTALKPTDQVQTQSTVIPGQPKKKILACFVNYAGYYGIIDAYVQYMKNPAAKIYDLQLVPIYYEAADGTWFYEMDEDAQAAALTDGTCDILYTTSDALRKNPSSFWLYDTDASADADQGYMREKGATENCKNADGSPKTLISFNDLAADPKTGIGKCKIGLVMGSVSEYSDLSLQRFGQISPDQVELVGFDDVGPAVDAFANGEVDAVFGWIDQIERSREVGIKIFSSRSLRLYDNILVSRDAAQNKHEEIRAVLKDFILAMNRQKVDLAGAAKDIANATWDGEHRLDRYTKVYPENAEKILRYYLGAIAQASFEKNLLIAQSPQILVNRLAINGSIWKWGGYDIPDVDLNTLYDTSFILELAQDPEVRSAPGEFVNNTYSPVAPKTLVIDQDTVLTIPTIATFGCANFEFPPGAEKLPADQKAILKECAGRISDALYSSDNTVVSLECHAAWPGPAGKYNEVGVSGVAFNRCISIKETLVDGGVPPELIVIVPIIPPVERQGTLPSTDPALNQDRVTVISLRGGGGQ